MPGGNYGGQNVTGYPAVGVSPVGSAYESSGLADGPWQNPSPAPLGTGSGGQSTLDQFVAADNQVNFPLSATPVDPTQVLFFVNGVMYDNAYWVYNAGLNRIEWGAFFAMVSGYTVDAFYLSL